MTLADVGGNSKLMPTPRQYSHFSSPNVLKLYKYDLFRPLISYNIR